MSAVPVAVSSLIAEYLHLTQRKAALSHSKKAQRNFRPSVDVHYLPSLDGDTRPVMRLPSDFWMLKHKDMKRHALNFAESGDKFVKAFAAAFQEMIGLGSARCSTTGTICGASQVCEKKLDSERFYIESTCKGNEVTDGPVCDADKCSEVWRNDSECDEPCNNEACNFDEGDCGEDGCNAGCTAEIRGDGQCNEACNVKTCNFDHGDCVEDECSRGCPKAREGDSECDRARNNRACKWDNGDCPVPFDNNKDCGTRFWGDFNDCCLSWAFFGHCERLSEYMLASCPNTCLAGKRFDPKLKEDWSVKCPSLAADGHCEESPEYMLVVCKASCKHAIQ